MYYYKNKNMIMSDEVKTLYEKKLTYAELMHAEFKPVKEHEAKELFMEGADELSIWEVLYDKY